MTDQKRGNLIKQSDDTYRRVDAEAHGAVQDDGYSNPTFGGAHVDLGERRFPTVLSGMSILEQQFQR